MTTPRKTQKQMAFGSEQRAVEEGHRAFVQPDASFRVVSDIHPGTSYNVTYFVVPTLTLIHFHCTCKAGEHRPHVPVPCKHSALVGRRLEREGYALWRDGEWYASDKAFDLAASMETERDVPSDPFVGLS